MIRPERCPICHSENTKPQKHISDKRNELEYRDIREFQCWKCQSVYQIIRHMPDKNPANADSLGRSQIKFVSEEGEHE